MFIRYHSYLEEGMSITYEDIRQQRAQLINHYEERRAYLQKAAYKLRAEYEDSLCLPAESWSDSKGEEHPYVMVGILDGIGQFQKTPLPTVALDDDYALPFVIATVVDDSSIGGGGQYIVNIRMWSENDMLRVEVGKGQKVFIISNPDEKGVYVEVCSAIKQLIMAGFTDPRLF